MPKLHMREVLMRELRAHRVSTDRQAGYLLVMADARVPCPHCYASGLLAMLTVAAVGGGTEHGVCAQCNAAFSWRARDADDGRRGASV